MQWIKTSICDECGVPAIWANWILVDSDNIAIDSKARLRGVFYEIKEVQNIFDKVEEVLGIPLSHVCFEAHKEAIRHFFEGALRGFLGNTVRKAVPGLVIRRMTQFAPLFGLGTMKILEFHRGESVKGESQNVWNKKLYAADAGGAFEAIAQFECDVESETVGDKLIQVARRRYGVIEEFEGRFAPVTGESIGTRDIPKCYHCGAPISFQVFEWNIELAEIRERDTGLRLVFDTPSAIDSLVLEIEKEIGSEIRDIVTRIEADYVKERILSGDYDALHEHEAAGEIIFEYMNLIRRRCFGNPIISDIDNSELRATIRNPVNETMVLGRVLGSYEAVTGEKGELHIKRDDEGLKVAVKPA